MKLEDLTGDLVAVLKKAGLAGKVWRAGDAANLPRVSGAYILLIKVRSQLSIGYGKRSAVLAPGWYIYAGSANGPGGLRARLGRHFKKAKPVRWHVDQLTITNEVRAIAMPGWSECALVAALCKSGRFSPPLEGFGSSDCRTCESHLLEFTALELEVET